MKTILKQLFISYGYTSILWALESFENEERYEVCEIILEFLRELEICYNIEIPHRLSDKVEKEYQESFEELIDLEGRTITKNISIYGENIRKVIIKHLENGSSYISV